MAEGPTPGSAATDGWSFSAAWMPDPAGPNQNQSALDSSALAARFSSHPRLGSTLRPPGFLAAHDHAHTYAHKDSGLRGSHAAPAGWRWVGGDHGRPCRWLCRCCVRGLRRGRPTLGPACVHGPRSNLPAALMYHWCIPKPGPRGGALDRGVSWVQQVGGVWRWLFVGGCWRSCRSPSLPEAPSLTPMCPFSPVPPRNCTCMSKNYSLAKSSLRTHSHPPRVQCPVKTPNQTTTPAGASFPCPSQMRAWVLV